MNHNHHPSGTKNKKKKSLIFPIILAVVIIGGGGYGYRAYSYRSTHEETDDAQIASNVAPVISKISDYVAEVRVKDNQFVKKGDTLVILDNRDQKIALKKAEAALATAQANIATAQATTVATSKSINASEAAVATADAQIEAAKVNVWKTSQDLKRYEHLVKDHSITDQQYEQALAAKQSADKQLQVLVDQKNHSVQQKHVASSQTVASARQIQVATTIAQQKAMEVEQARLDLSYTFITAPEEGFVGKVPIQTGQYLQVGAQLFSLVKNDKKWVVANFKETQVDRMVEGQKVKIEIDAFPDETFEGVVSSFSPATGAAFSILPPDNASGNFVKVVQRLPVKIDFVHLDKTIAQKLRMGMNVQVEVTLH